MNYRKLGTTGIRVSEIGLGTWSAGGSVRLGGVPTGYGNVPESEAVLGNCKRRRKTALRRQKEYALCKHTHLGCRYCCFAVDHSLAFNSASVPINCRVGGGVWM